MKRINLSDKTEILLTMYEVYSQENVRFRDYEWKILIAGGLALTWLLTFVLNENVYPKIVGIWYDLIIAYVIIVVSIGCAGIFLSHYKHTKMLEILDKIQKTLLLQEKGKYLENQKIIIPKDITFWYGWPYLLSYCLFLVMAGIIVIIICRI